MLETRRHGLISWLASTTLTVAAVGLFVLSLGSCNRDGQQMAGGVIAQNDVFTMTGDSILEDTVYATATGPDYIKTNVSLQGIQDASWSARATTAACIVPSICHWQP